jgi:hypothetical protein
MKSIICFHHYSGMTGFDRYENTIISCHCSLACCSAPYGSGQQGIGIAYASSINEGFDLYVVGIDGSKPRLLKATGNGVLHHIPLAWSLLIPDKSNHSVLGWTPDGKHILFSTDRSGSTDAWLIAVADGKTQGEPVFVRKDWGSWPMGFTRSGAFFYGVNNNAWDVKIAELDPAGGSPVSPGWPTERRWQVQLPR